MNLTFGSDPEVFVCENYRDQDYAVPVPYFFSNHNVKPISIDVQRKHPVILKGKDYKVIMDGVAFELNVKPTNTAKDMFNIFTQALDSINDLAEKYKYKLVVKPTVRYDFNKFFKENDFMLYQCGIFGCDKDMDAILLDYDSPEIDAVKHTYRYGGGHLHISDNNELINRYPVPFVKLLAVTCGNYAVATSKYPDLEKLRAWKYGQPGRYRIQNYPNDIIGVEYRTPSNNWISDLNIIEGMIEYANKAYSYLQNTRVDIIEDYLNDTIKAIGNTDIALAKSILNSLN